MSEQELVVSAFFNFFSLSKKTMLLLLRIAIIKVTDATVEFLTTLFSGSRKMASILKKTTLTKSTRAVVDASKKMSDQISLRVLDLPVKMRNKC